MKREKTKIIIKSGRISTRSWEEKKNADLQTIFTRFTDFNSKLWDVKKPRLLVVMGRIEGEGLGQGEDLLPHRLVECGCATPL